MSLAILGIGSAGNDYATFGAAPTKSQEIETFRAFVAAQPVGSYLASILKGSEGYVESNIRNDFAFPLAGHLRQLEQDAACKAEELKQLQKKVGEARAEVRLLESKIATAQRSLEQAADAARGVLRYAK